MATVLSVTGLGAACGGGGDAGRLPTPRWIEEADEICATANTDHAALQPPAFDPFDETLSVAQLDEVAAYLERSLAIEADTTRRLDRLGLPHDDAGEIEDVLAQREAGREATEAAIGAARAADGEEFAASYRIAVTEYEKASRGARDFGLRRCGQ